MIKKIFMSAFNWGRELQQRYNAIHGSSLAAAITLYGFLALFALLILAVAIIGLIAGGQKGFAKEVVGDLGITGSSANSISKTIQTAQTSHRLGTIIGVLGILWLGSSFALAITHAFNAAWGITGLGMISRGRGLLWLAGFSALALGELLFSSLWSLLPNFLSPLSVLLGLVVNSALWFWTSWILPRRKVPWRVVLVPSVIAAALFEILKFIGSFVVPRLVSSSSELYGSLGLVFALLAWLLIIGRLIVYLAVVEAWRGEKEVSA